MIILGLGSNIGDRIAHLRAGVAALAEVLRDMRVSPVYESAALLPASAPKEWDIAYYNMAVCGESALSPLELLAEIKTVEQKLGRVFRGVWGPREIDIDILAMGSMVLDSPELTIPHKGLLVRDFALLPLVNVAPNWRHPQTGELAADIGDKYALKKIGTL